MLKQVRKYLHQQSDEGCPRDDMLSRDLAYTVVYDKEIHVRMALCRKICSGALVP